MESNTTISALDKAEKIISICEILGVKPDEIIDRNDEITMEEFKETISQQCDSEDEEEPAMVNGVLDTALKNIKEAMIEALTDTFVHEYYAG